MKLVYSLTVVLLACLFLSAALLYLPEKERITLSGIVQAKEMKDASAFGGRVKEVLVEEGDQVTKGQPLIVFENDDLMAKMAQAEAVLEQAEAQYQMVSKGADSTVLGQARARVDQAQQQLKLLSTGGSVEVSQAEAKVSQAEAVYKKAQAAYESAPRMLSEGIISQQKFNDIQLDYQQSQSALNAARETLSRMRRGGGRQEQIRIAQADVRAANEAYKQLVSGASKEQLEVAKADVDKAKSLLDALKSQWDETTLKARIDGEVVTLDLQPGELVLPGQAVISLRDANSLWADVYIPEDKLYLVEPGQQADVVASAYRRTRFTGKIATINSKSEFVPSNKSSDSGEAATFRVKVKIQPKSSNKDKILHPGMRVDVTFAREIHPLGNP